MRRTRFLGSPDILGRLDRSVERTGINCLLLFQMLLQTRKQTSKCTKLHVAPLCMYWVPAISVHWLYRCHGRGNGFWVTMAAAICSASNQLIPSWAEERTEEALLTFLLTWSCHVTLCSWPVIRCVPPLWFLGMSLRDFYTAPTGT